MHSWVCHFFGGMDCVSMYECMLCMYMCMCDSYIVCMNVAIYVCNPSDMTDTNFYLQALPDGTKALKQPHKYYCQVRSGTKNTVILCVGLARGTLPHESSMTRRFVKNL